MALRSALVRPAGVAPGRHRGWLLGFALGLQAALGLGGCSDRQVEPDYTQYIQDACDAACPVTTDCDPESKYDSADACIAGCAVGWTELDQCDSRTLEFMLCLGRLSCDEYSQYLEFVNHDVPLDQSWACLDELVASYDCDTSKPFEGPK